MSIDEAKERLTNALRRWPLDGWYDDIAASISVILTAYESQEADSKRLDWIEAQTNGRSWCARQSSTGRGFRLHNTIYAPSSDTAREAIDAAIKSAALPPETGS